MRKILFLPTLLCLFMACDSDKESFKEPADNKKEVKIELEERANMETFKWLRLNPTIEAMEEYTCSWLLEDQIISGSEELLHLFDRAGEYKLTFALTVDQVEHTREIVVTVTERQYANNALKVFDFLPAPGQSVNKLPAWEQGDTHKEMVIKAQQAIASNSLVHLGSFGGYITMGFDHTIYNRPDTTDFRVLGNAFAGWAEPGVVMVSFDANSNGLPDDQWYEIAGSAHGSAETQLDYQITYHKPEEGKIPTPGAGVSDAKYIYWEDNLGGSGYVEKNSFNNQNYYPEWHDKPTLTFKGSLLRSNLVLNGSFWANTPYDWGYADNWANNDARSGIDISWAVDSLGNPANLKGVDFIKVYTGCLGQGAMMGELSTEVSGVVDLNME